MNITLGRTYKPDCTLGIIKDDQGNQICYSLELPNLNNTAEASCIPEGSYNFNKLFSSKLGWVYRLQNVPNRSLIDVHSANIAPELRGCIAVGLKQGTMDYQGKTLTAVLQSRDALAKLFTIVGTNGAITITS